MRRNWLVSLLAVLALVTASAPASGQQQAREVARHWVHTWTAMPQLTEPGNMPPAEFIRNGVVLPDTTLRQTVRFSVGGDRIRLRFSNAFGGAPLPITSVSVATPLGGKAGVAGIEPGSARPVTFRGKPGAIVPAGALVVSDPLDFSVRAQENVTVTAYFAAGQASTAITSHPGSRTTSYLVAGDHVSDATLTGSTPIDHWYFLSGAEVFGPKRTEAAAIVGDSLTDGRGSTTNGNDRWPDRLGLPGVAVLNQAAGGNRVLADGLGPNLLSRLDRDVLAQSGVSWLVVFEGVNDIGTAAATPEAQRRVAGELIDAYDQIVVRAQAHGIRVYGATLTPFGGNSGYDSPDREATRQTVNTWIRTSGRFDAVLDFDRVARDPQAPSRLLPAYDVGDHLHLSPAGYRALAESVPANLFRR
ncbi:SGNH hydrolase [Amycolatopsis orientalis]|uniref:SGNH hydrolase n=1 Tax=Amycolatopsis orientalis TaxID=31958 RepID=A0A193C049_AMYOR|nr:SGNH/GDSL hydrolase family protein [Amycolatopsis orientalis]ANN17847.1 SGNH hydrolase [Amycolatopsis orientalis]